MEKKKRGITLERGTFTSDSVKMRLLFFGIRKRGKKRLKEIENDSHFFTLRTALLFSLTLLFFLLSIDLSRNFLLERILDVYVSSHHEHTVFGLFFPPLMQLTSFLIRIEFYFSLLFIFLPSRT